MAQVHIGKKIREVLDKSNLTVVEFAKRINLSRDGAYKIFAKKYIDTEQLNQISKVLNHDFFGYFSQDLSIIKEPKDKFGFATKDEVENIKHMMENILKELESIKKNLPAKKSTPKKEYIKTKKVNKK